jgi:hypothetical protein
MSGMVAGRGGEVAAAGLCGLVIDEGVCTDAMEKIKAGLTWMDASQAKRS